VKHTALSALPYPLPGCKGSILIRRRGRGGREGWRWGKKRGGKFKGNERASGRAVLWSPKKSLK